MNFHGELPSGNKMRVVRIRLANPAAGEREHAGARWNLFEREPQVIQRKQNGEMLPRRLFANRAMTFAQDVRTRTSDALRISRQHFVAIHAEAVRNVWAGEKPARGSLRTVTRGTSDSKRARAN